MRNVYWVRLVKPVAVREAGGDGAGKEVWSLYVAAPSFAAALAAVDREHPGAEVRGMDLLNHAGVPLVGAEG
jgi:hypothetical protein